jgi:hypothetical protein
MVRPLLALGKRNPGVGRATVQKEKCHPSDEA